MPDCLYLKEVVRDDEEDDEDEDYARRSTDSDNDTSVAFTRFSKGYVGFVGDVNAEEMTTKIMGILAAGYDDPTLFLKASFHNMSNSGQIIVLTTLLCGIRLELTESTLPILPDTIWVYILESMSIADLCGLGR